MTQHPEAVLAAEAGIPYAGLAIVTDHDVGVEDDPDVEPVTQDQVFAAFERSIDTVRELLVAAIGQISATGR
jgi:5'-methylthioadenosine phosphorylase